MPTRHAIRAKLPRPVPEGGIGRVLIYKTYKDPRTYQMNGDDLVWVRSLSGYRLGVILPKGYAFTSSNVAAQLATTTDGRLKLAFANPSGQANPVTIHARKTNAVFTPQPFMDVFFDDVKTLYDLDQPDTGRVNVDQTYSDYRSGAGGGARHAVVSPVEQPEGRGPGCGQAADAREQRRNDQREARGAHHQRASECASASHRHHGQGGLHHRQRRAPVHDDGVRAAEHGAAAVGLGGVGRVAVGRRLARIATACSSRSSI